MDLVEVLRSTAAIREFDGRPVPDDVLARVLDNARFAPNGGNAQAWHVIVVKDAAVRAAIRELYVDGFARYVTMRAAGLRPWAPVTDRDSERAAVDAVDVRAVDVGPFAAHFDEIPAMLVVLADLRLLAAVDRDLDRYTLVGGASVYPFVWSILLAARAEELGGVLTTMPIAREPELKKLLDVPDEFAVCGVLALGYPTRRPTKLTRKPVGEFTTINRFSGPPLANL